MPILILCLRYLPPSTIDDTLDVYDLIGNFEGLISVFPSSLMTASSGTFSEGNFANLFPKLTLIAILGPPLSRRAAFALRGFGALLNCCQTLYLTDAVTFEEFLQISWV